ncbi:unnamed protein product [Nippostrongylus brasiliensis]|uniref:Isobutyryl-CoA dehydrogenase, mitochondrial (inferred by orthology to a human protein) n=1 Tax=Nippostrongylus brasiliensis TaxID=27835 RepID=A0A0N4Y245_NIPBR|nr:unnamed protein product [Nippostrongylus brasiliensis]
MITRHLRSASSTALRVFKRRSHLYCIDPAVGLDADMVEVQKVARDFAKNEMYPNMAKWDREEYFPIETLRHAGELGFGAIYCSDEFGGSGLSRLHASVIYEQLAAGCVSTTAYITIHNMVAWMIDKYGSKELREKHIPKLASFEHAASYCLTEPDSGSDAASLRTTARREGDYYVVNGSKAFISGAGSSQVYLVMVRHDSQPGPKGIFCLLIEDGMEGFSQAKKESKLGWNTQPTRIISFEDVKVPISNQVGPNNYGFNIAMAGLNGGRVSIASCSLGGAQQSIDLAIELIVRDAARHLDAGSSHLVPLCAMAKLHATENCSEVVNQALQMYGGYGFLKDYPMQQYLRDLRVHQILEGTNEIMRMLVSRDLLGNETYGPI